MRHVAWINFAALSLACLPIAACAQPPAAPATEFTDAGALLTALEKADEHLITLTAKVDYDKTFEIQGDRQLRRGKLYFVNKDESDGSDPAKKTATRKFAIKFDELWIGDVIRREEQIFIFDGQWLVEKDPVHKEFKKRQVVPPGEHFDPLKIGEGPLPIPIGQKRADIEQRFNSSMVPAADGLAPAADATTDEIAEATKRQAYVSGGWQIKLTPKPGFERETDFKEVRLWYKRDASGNLLPVMARTVGKELDVSVVRLSNVQVQLDGAPKNEAAAVPGEVIDVQPPREGWNVRIEEFRRPAGN